jgi:hypothetical protein
LIVRKTKRSSTMNKFALLGLFGLVGSSAAFSPVASSSTKEALFSTTRTSLSASTKLIDPAVVNVAAPAIAVPAPETVAPVLAAVAAKAPKDEWTGEHSKTPINTYVSAELEELSIDKQRLVNPVSFSQRQRQTVSLSEIRGQQHQHGLSVEGVVDHTRNSMRN